MKEIPMAKYLLGTDNGCTVAKAALFTLAGEELAVASRKIETITPRLGYVEMDMLRSWQATVESIREVLSQAQIDPKDIACIASAGHGNGLYLVDKQGQPVYNAISSTDARARKYADRWIADGVDKAIRPKTMQAVWPAQPNALLAWLRDHEPEVMKQAGWVLMCKDYIRFRLTGQIAAELTDFSGTSLLNVGAGDYDDEVLEAFGIAEMRGLLPPLVRSADICGEVTPEAAAETGLAEGTPVAGGMFDIDACGLATGLTDEGPLCMIAGTWGNNQYISKTPVVDEDVFMTSCYAIPDYYLMLEGSATSASNLEWFVTEFFAAERQAAGEKGQSVFDLVNDLVAATTPEETAIVFLPFLYGSNVNPDAKCSLIGLNNYHGRGHVLRAIYEGVVFGHRFHVDRLLKFRSMPERIRFTGGAARSEVWVQIFADCFGVPVDIPEGTELGALGAAILAAVASGCYDSFEAAVGAMVKFTRTQEPDASRKDLYDAKYARYTRVIEALDPVWRELG
jgi:L-xylulokinase